MVTRLNTLQRRLILLETTSTLPTLHRSDRYSPLSHSLHLTFLRQNQTTTKQSDPEQSDNDEQELPHSDTTADAATQSINGDQEATKLTSVVIKKRKKKHNALLSKEEKGFEDQVTLKTLYQKYWVQLFFPPPPPISDKRHAVNLLDTYTWRDKWIDRLARVGIVNPRGDWKEREKLAMLKKGGVQTNLGNERIGRALNSAEQVKKKYGAKKRATKEQIYAEVEKYYKVFGGFVTMRHWRTESWYGIPVKMWVFFYLCAAGMLVVAVTYHFNTPAKIEDNPKIAENQLTEHVPFVIDKLRANRKVMSNLGSIENPKLSKLPPADRNNFRARFVHEVWADTEKEGLVRIVLIYDSEQCLEGICRLEVHMDDEILKIDFEDEEQRDLDKLVVVRCPPDLFPLMHWFTQSRREIFTQIPRYLWPLAPLGCLLAVARWHYRTPPGLANYVLDQLKSHVIIRRALGSPVHLQSDQWRGRLTSRSCNMRVLLEGSKHTGKVNVIGYRDGSTRWLFPNAVLMIDGVKHDHYREIYITPFEIPQTNK